MRIVIPILVICAALMDGFQHSNRKLTGSVFKSLFILGVCSLFFFEANGWYAAYLLLAWWVLFDLIYNITRRLPLFFVGTTKWTDKLIRLIVRDNAAHLSWITKLMALACIFALYYRGLI